MTQSEKIAKAAKCDIRTVRRLLSGDPVRPALAERIVAAMKTLQVPVPKYVTTSTVA